MSKLRWRRAWFQVHKWIGLALAILIVPLGLSGSALVWHDALDRALNPARYAVSGEARLAPDAYLAAATRALPRGERVAQLSWPDGAGPVVVAAAPVAVPARPGPPPRTLVYLDPPTARVLEVASSGTGAVRFLHGLHGSLLVPGVGRTIVGWVGVAMMVSCLTGMWLWWPTVGRWSRGLRWRRQPTTSANLHHLVGFWVALPLFMLSLTGAWIAFPAVVGALTGDGSRQGPNRAALARAQPIATPAQPIATVIARARVLGGGKPRSVGWPTTLSADWTVTFADRRSVKVADDTGTAVAAPVRDAPGGALLMRRLHDGTGMGPVWQAMIFLAGLMPAVLAVTGVVMWWRMRRGRRVRVKPVLR